MEELYTSAKDGHRIFYRVWRAGSPLATLHLLHGMAEHSLRYDWFARYLNSLSITVYAQDHRGHGLTKEENEKGWFAEEDGWMTIARDSWLVDEIIMDENELLPHFLMGHSMGSFLARTVITEHPSSFDGLIIMGSGASKGMAGRIGKLLAERNARRNGSRMPDHQMDKLSFGNYNSRIQSPRTQYDWLSRDPEEVDKYIADPLCGFVCSSRFYADLIEGVEIANDKSRAQRIKKDTPVLVISGDADPVGGYGKGVKKVYKEYVDAGLEDVTLHLVPGGRHELLNETDKKESAAFIGAWLEKQLGKDEQ